MIGHTGTCRLALFSGLFAAVLLLAMHSGAKEHLMLGANVNETGIALEPELLEQSRTTLCRAFFPSTHFVEGRRDLKTDADLLAVKRAGESGQKIILCLKWNFEQAKWRVPDPGSEREQKCFEWADALIGELDGYLVALETVNEVTVDTLKEDMVPNEDGVIPMVRFLQRLVEHLDAQDHKGMDGKALPLYSGGFIRLELKGVRNNPGVQALLDWIQQDDRVAGANFHIHMPAFAGFETYLKYIRTRVTEKPYVVTEFSLVHEYQKSLNEPVAASSAGKRFLKKYDYGSAMSVREYVNACLADPVPEKEWNEFLDSQTWYDGGFLKSACRVMEEYGVVMATFAFQQKSSGGRPLKEDATPWILNPIFANKVAVGRSGRSAIAENFMKDYLNWQKR
ncbi:MAG: hypothetical protein JXR25_15475 [Pontiellaceae bacterium]|nr:hypothetical protein [Pontiellaceae bacterium]MBN2786220.1 hypothetical protein [Pontiellaceae bacterium]